jgi:GTPase SAR1 family protein
LLHEARRFSAGCGEAGKTTMINRLQKNSRLITNALTRLKKMKAPVLQTASAISSL